MFKREGTGVQARIVVDASARARFNASAASDDAYRAFDQVLDRVAKRLRRHKRWLADHRAGPDAATFASGTDGPARARHSLMQGDGERNDEAPKDAVVVAELDTPIVMLTVADAARMLDLGEEPAFVFRNASTEAVNIVYRRIDGNVGWIEA